LRVTQGKDLGATATLEGGLVVIGTGQDCDLVLPDDTISARHCEISLDQGALRVRDLGSTNGIKLKQARIRDASLEPGSRILLGTTEILLEEQGRLEIPIAEADSFGPMVGSSLAMRSLYAQLAAVARSQAPLLIEGETGAGKDLAAEAVHLESPRAKGPYIVLDCGAVAGNLLDAELFGHERGAFTGAVAARAGLVEAAEGGPLVLDEIGELPLELQPKLLRLLERKQARRVGNTQTRSFDVRVIACTNRNLRSEVRARRFREDLYFRLAALKLKVPPLRQRLEDLPMLVDLLLEQSGSTVRFATLPESSRELLRAHRWPGNVRELRNVVDRLVAFEGTPTELIDQDGGPTRSVSISSGAWLPLPIAREKATEAFERRYLELLLKRAEGIKAAAQQAGVSRQFLQRLLRKHKLTAPKE
jgi:transcriptional regulator with GAF, ATPase, and Fis domain